MRYVYRILTAKPREKKTARDAVTRMQMKYVSENQAVWIWTELIGLEDLMGSLY
jgi:hypothetical protein